MSPEETPQAAKPNSLPSLVTFDDHGDLRLVVGEGGAKRTFVVCSRSLARASKVFKTMLYGGFAESNPQQPDWTVELPEDDPQALSTILHIVHGPFNAIPTALIREELYQVCIFTDKYDMTSVLQPWAKKWVELYLNKWASDGVEMYFGEGNELWVWIGWELGSTSLFTRSLNELIEYCWVSTASLSAKTEVLILPGVAIGKNVYLANIDVPDLVATERLRHITEMLSLVQTAIDDLISHKFSATLPSWDKRKSREAETFYLGSIMMALIPMGLYPLPRPEAYMHNMGYLRNTLCQALRSMETMDCSTVAKPFSADDLVQRLEKCTSAISLVDAQRKHLAEQASKSGVERNDIFVSDS